MKILEISKASIYQFCRYAFVGVINTVIDFLILNLLINIYGLEKEEGSLYILFKGISFLIAVTNSYILNRLWVFKNPNGSGQKTTTQIGSFLAISLIGLIIDTVVAIIIFKIGHSAFPDVSTQLWANVGALAGTGLVLFSNFFGYKYLVFKK